jgi:hypothetical protein
MGSWRLSALASIVEIQLDLKAYPFDYGVNLRPAFFMAAIRKLVPPLVASHNVVRPRTTDLFQEPIALSEHQWLLGFALRAGNGQHLVAKKCR